MMILQITFAVVTKNSRNAWGSIMDRIDFSISLSALGVDARLMPPWFQIHLERDYIKSCSIIDQKLIK